MLSDGWLVAPLQTIAAPGPCLTCSRELEGVILRRGVFVGRRAYEVAHYTTLSRAEMSAIFAEANEALRA